MTTVYVVTEGEYSDYCIRGMYSSLEKAERAKIALNSENSIEEWGLDVDLPIRKNRLPYEISMDYEMGEITRIRRVSIEHMQNPIQLMKTFDKKNSVLIVQIVWARDESHAIKIAADKLEQFVYELRQNNLNPRDIVKDYKTTAQFFRDYPELINAVHPEESESD